MRLGKFHISLVYFALSFLFLPLSIALRLSALACSMKKSLNKTMYCMQTTRCSCRYIHTNTYMQININVLYIHKFKINTEIIYEIVGVLQNDTRKFISVYI